jgi:hypothetical protein
MISETDDRGEVRRKEVLTIADVARIIQRKLILRVWPRVMS